MPFFHGYLTFDLISQTRRQSSSSSIDSGNKHVVSMFLHLRTSFPKKFSMGQIQINLIFPIRNREHVTSAIITANELCDYT